MPSELDESDLDWLDELKRKLAAIEHQRWADWQRWVHDECQRVNGELVIPPHLEERWERQIITPFEELSEAEQASDLAQVDRYWPLILAELEKLEQENRRLEGQIAHTKELLTRRTTTLRERAERLEAALVELLAAENDWLERARRIDPDPAAGARWSDAEDAARAALALAPAKAENDFEPDADDPSFRGRPLSNRQATANVEYRGKGKPRPMPAENEP